jgi:ADP-ribose pyrophosphatase YjhB (NUDIX family)
MITGQIVLINEEGLILGVSRKDNHNDFGLPGGKMDPEDNGDPMVTAIRECKEETGLDVYDLQLVFAIHKSGNMGYTYLAKYSGEINHNEPHVVKWVPMQVLINGSFGRYNQMVSESLTDMGVDYQLDVDIIALSDEVEEYLQNNKLLGLTFKLKELRKETNFVGKTVYTVYFDVKYDEFLWDIDNEFIDGLEALGQKHGVKLQIPYYYYSK